MKRLLYIGNKLDNSKSNVTSIVILGRLLEEEGYEVRYASSIKNVVLRLFDMIFTVITYRNTSDYILIDTYSTLNFYYAFIVSQLARWFGIPFIPILRGGELPSRLISKPKMCARIFENAYLNIAPSKYLKDQFEASGYQNIKYIPNTIQIENYPFEGRGFENPKLLWVRSFASIYNPLMAVKVAKRLQETGHQPTLCMVGPDSDGTLHAVKEFAKKQQVEVRFTGKLTKQEWVTFSKDYNIFINTTHIDNTPVSVIEAMALGLPVVSTNVGGMPYLIENDVTGLLVAADDVNAMVEGIELLMKDSKKREDIIQNARTKAESFDWQDVKERWIEILEGKD